MKFRRFNRTRPRFAHGFTLMEVLVALLIVSLGMLGVIQAVGQAASNTSYLRDKTMAHWIAMNRITELRLQANPPQLGEASGDIEMADREWRWNSVVTKTPVETMSRIDVTVALKEDEDSPLTTLTGFFGTAVAPPESGSVSWQSVSPVPTNPQGEDDSNPPPPPPSTPEPDPPASGGTP
jgi:general secretion pathway protein I